MQEPDRRITISLDPPPYDPVRVLHPCRCDAPDPEATRYEPLEIPLTPLREHGSYQITCPECDYHLHAVAAPRRD